MRRDFISGIVIAGFGFGHGFGGVGLAIALRCLVIY